MTTRAIRSAGMRYCPKCGQRADAAQARCSRCLNELVPFTGTVRGAGFNFGESPTSARKFSDRGRGGRREVTLAGFGTEVQEQQPAGDGSTGQLAQNAIVPAPVVTLQEVAVPSHSSAVRVSRPSPLQTVDIGIIISTGEAEGHDATFEIDATATLHGTAPPPRGLEQRRGTTGTLRGAAVSFQRSSGDTFALRAPLRPSETVRLSEGTEVLSPSIAPAAQYTEARAASRLAVARVSIADEEAPPNQYRRRQSSGPRTMDVSALFYRIDAEVLGPPSSPISAAPSSSQAGVVQSKAKPWRWKAFRLRSPVAFYSLLTTILVFLVWGCVRLAMKP